VSTPPGVIPYVEHHAGPRRVLTLVLKGNGLATTPPVVGIDGRDYVVVWGTVLFEVPADRPCHLSVRIEGDRVPFHASALLDPGPDLLLTYSCKHTSRVGQLA
jgi:hypothetical protein